MNTLRSNLHQADGVGITPLYAMAEALEAAAIPFVLHYYLKQRGDHRDTVQSDAEKRGAEQYIALCCSRSFSPDLLIDL